jgi:hypothetical protein
MACETVRKASAVNCAGVPGKKPLANRPYFLAALLKFLIRISNALGFPIREKKKPENRI